MKFHNILIFFTGFHLVMTIKELATNSKTNLNDILYTLQVKNSQIDLETKRKIINLLQTEKNISKVVSVYELAINEYLKTKQVVCLSFIELITFVFPDLLYCTLKGENKPLSQRIFQGKSFSDLIRLLPVIELQKYQLKSERDYHPKTLEIFFDYYFIHFRKKEFQKQIVLESIVEIIKSMVKNSHRVIHPDFKLPLIKISVFNSLLNYCFLDHPEDKKTRKLYDGVKYLLFSTTHNCILTNHPNVIFTTFMGPLSQELDDNFKNELLDILTCLLITRKDTSQSILTEWIEKYPDYVNESGIFIQHLLQQCNRGGKFYLFASSTWQKVIVFLS